MASESLPRAQTEQQKLSLEKQLLTCEANTSFRIPEADYQEKIPQFQCALPREPDLKQRFHQYDRGLAGPKGGRIRRGAGVWNGNPLRRQFDEGDS